MIECIKPPEDVANYVCTEREVKMHRPRYDSVSGQFIGLYESIGYLVVTGDQEEQFVDCDIVRKTLIITA